jgi:hypothetical protein
MDWLESLVDVVIQAWPLIKQWMDTATITITAIPNFLGKFLGLPVWLYGLLGGGFLIFAWNFLFGDEPREERRRNK